VYQGWSSRAISSWRSAQLLEMACSPGAGEKFAKPQGQVSGFGNNG
jgi:hypothetical protein